MHPLKDVEDHFKEQIAIGKGLQGYIFLPSSAEASERETNYNQWSEFITRLLVRSFNDDYFLNEYLGLPLETAQNQSMSERVRVVRVNAQARVAKLESILKQLKLIPQLNPQSTITEPLEPGFKTQPSKAVSTLQKRNDVLIVHGHDHDTKNTVARFIEGLGPKVTILHEKPDRGRTIIEKIEQNADIGCVVVLLTADDVGGEKAENQKLSPRARQNVVFELGFFIGLLGRGRVSVLYAKDVEIPTDYSGVLYIPLDQEDAWQLKLARELKATGISISPDKLV